MDETMKARMSGPPRPASSPFPCRLRRPPASEAVVGHPLAAITSVALVLGGLVLFAWPTPATGCFNLPHEWSRIVATPAEPCLGSFALTDALFRFRALVDERLAARGMASAPVTIAFIGWERGEEAPAGPAQVAAVGEALATSWPFDRYHFHPDALLPKGDIESLAAAAARATSPVSASIVVRDNSGDQIALLDLVFWRWTMIRHILRERATLDVRVMTRGGEVILLETIDVSPTVVADTMLSPAGCFTTYLEARTERPAIVDFGELVKPAEAGPLKTREQKFRMPDYSGSRPMSPPSGP